MTRNNYPYIALEGWPVLLILAVTAIVLQFRVGGVLPFICLACLLFFAYLIRDPKPVIPSKPLAVVSPVDGILRNIEKARDPFLEREAIQLRIEMRWWNVYSLRNVIEGKVFNQWCHLVKTPGRAAQFAWWVQTDEGDDVLTSVHIKRHPGRFRFTVQSGQRLGHGQRCGFLFFGTTVEVWVPESSRIIAEVDQPLRSGESILSEFVHREAVSAISS